MNKEKIFILKPTGEIRAANPGEYFETDKQIWKWCYNAGTTEKDYPIYEISESLSYWQPQIGETYYMPVLLQPELYCTDVWSNNLSDLRVYDKGLVCKTKDKAIELATEIFNHINSL